MKMNSDKAIRLFIQSLKDENADVRRHAIKALGKICGTHAMEPILVAINDNDKTVREQAFAAMHEIGTIRKNAFEPITVAIKDSDEVVRAEAASVLGEIGRGQNIRVEEFLIPALTDSNVDVRRQVIKALGKIGETSAIEPLRTTLKDNDEAIRMEAGSALKKLYIIQQKRDEYAASDW